MAVQPHQIAGAILEEVVLAVLPGAGYRPLVSTHGDPTVVPGEPRFTLRGRGTTHQIDAVADPTFGLPFSNPPRLLVEAKAYSRARKVGLKVVRNALGTMRDLSEYWRAEGTRPGERLPRYHYRYAIFATTEFTSGAQEFAYAQDIYLLPLRRSVFFSPVVEAIDHLREWFEAEDRRDAIVLSTYRREVRDAIMDDAPPPEGSEGLVEASRRVGRAIIAVAERRFPLFLVPETPETLEMLGPQESVRIYRRGAGWEIRREGGPSLFTFDVPEALARMYAPGGQLNSDQAIDMKLGSLRSMDAVVDDGTGRPRLVRFDLDVPWLEAVRAQRRRPDQQ